MDKRITIADVRRHIKRCERKRIGYHWLSFVENKDLTPEVEALFTLSNPTGAPAYDWVKGNQKLKDLVNATIE